MPGDSRQDHRDYKNNLMERIHRSVHYKLWKIKIEYKRFSFMYLNINLISFFFDICFKSLHPKYLINILLSAIQVNVVNVYIGQIKDMNDLKKFMNLAWAHFPFFLQSVLFRITAFGFFLVYLNLLAAIPFFFLLISNLIINYYTAATRKIPKSLKQKHIMLSNTDAVHVWLNSFLSICVPTCLIQDVDPTILQDMQQKHKEDVYQGQKEFQKKVMRQQVNVSTTIILLTLLSVFILVCLVQLRKVVV